MQIKPGVQDEYEKYVAVNNADAYSARVVSYGEEWAALMEAGIAEGKALADIAESTSREADTDGITGFMYGAAVSGLSHFWAHGDALRTWHNRQYIKDEKDEAEADAASTEGKTVNPAILTVSL